VFSLPFEFFIANRYLRAKRKQAVISLITVISILGVAAGVTALVIALAINNGFRNTLQKNLLGATAHVTLLEAEPSSGIEEWRELLASVEDTDGVQEAMPALYGTIFLSGPLMAEAAVLKGLDTENGRGTSMIASALVEGDLERLKIDSRYPGIVLGARLAERTGMMMESIINVISPYGEPTPFGPRPLSKRFRVVGIVETGFYDIDARWAFTSLNETQILFGLGDVVNAVELRLDDIYQAPQIREAVQEKAGEAYAVQTWMEQNQQILSALRMEKVVTVITIGLIQMVAALNILIVLVMLVMEKYRDIALLMSMGAKARQVRRIFIAQGMLISAVGTFIGLIAGYTLAFLGETYRWIRLDAEVYALSYVPFQPRPLDALWIAAITLTVSFLATLYPASNASSIPPAEALRYE
jgi:lipoprotein-releasing system permease protein